MLGGLSFVIPVYNERENVARVVQSCTDVGDRVSRQHEVIVVDDGSRDGTGDVLAELSSRDARVVVVHHDTNRGIAEATRDGFAAARLEYVFYTDGDGQFDVSEISLLLPYCKDHEFVVGYRAHRADPLHRRLNAAAYNALLRLLFRLPVRDVNCAFKLIRTDSLRRLDACSNSAFYLAELLIRAAEAGMRIREVPVHHYPRQRHESSGARMAVIAPALRDLAVFRRRKSRAGRRPER